jgi:RNA polymerase sigma-70 factor (ECF subfamily)
MASIRDGDAEALQALMDLFWTRLVRYAAALTHCADEAEDVVQRVFISVWETRSRYTASGSVSAYLFRIARNSALVRIRRDEVRRRLGPEVKRRHDSVPSPLDYTAFDELRSAFEVALRSLPPRRREAFELVRIQGLSLHDSGQVMGATRRTVANHVYLASLDLEKKLRRFLG